MDEDVPAPDLVEELAVGCRDREARLGHAPPALLLEIGAVEVDDLVEVGEVEQPVDAVDLVVARRRGRP